MEGFLRKRNKHGKWQQRWFVLGASELRYFESATSSVPKGVIPLGGGRIESVWADELPSSLSRRVSFACHSHVMSMQYMRTNCRAPCRGES